MAEILKVKDSSAHMKHKARTRIDQGNSRKGMHTAPTVEARLQIFDKMIQNALFRYKRCDWPNQQQMMFRTVTGGCQLFSSQM